MDYRIYNLLESFPQLEVILDKPERVIAIRSASKEGRSHTSDLAANDAVVTELKAKAPREVVITCNPAFIILTIDESLKKGFLESLAFWRK